MGAARRARALLVTDRAQDDGHDALVSLRGTVRRYRGDTPKIGVLPLADVGQAMLRFDRLARRVDLERPWATAGAENLDGQTFETWIRRTLRTPRGRDFFRIGCEAVFATQAANLSLLHALFYSASGTSFTHLLTTGGGAQHAKVVGGMMQLSQRLAEGLGDRVRLGEPVRRITHTRRRGRAHRPGPVRNASRRRDRSTVRGERHLVRNGSTGPPRRPAPAQPPGSVIKCHVVYPVPFWRDAGLSGGAAGDTSPVKVVFDATPPASGAPGFLVAFVEGADALRASAQTPAERRTAVLRVLTGYLCEAAAEPTGFLEEAWSAEEFTRGCYGAHLPPGAWTQVGSTLREPVGVIHWAGAETATRWCGYIDGAISSGERASQEVLTALS